MSLFEDASARKDALPNGEIFRQMRCAARAGRSADAALLQRKMSKDVRKPINRLYREHRALAQAFDDLLPFYGHWARFKAGSVHRILRLRCEEECVRYLCRTRSIWLHIVGTPDHADLVDSRTVELLELLAPSHSTHDREDILRLANDGQLFPKIRDAEMLASFVERVMEVRGRILSLHTFQEDTKHLEPCAIAMGQLLGRMQNTISLQQQFHGRLRINPDNGKCPLQLREDVWTEVDTLPENGSRLRYIQLWLFAERNWPFMEKPDPRQDSGAPRVYYNIVPQMLNAFAAFAWDMGYESPVIVDRKERDCCIKDLAAFVQQESSSAEQPNSGSLIDRQCEAPSRNEAAIVAEQDNEPRDRRCGRPYNLSYILDRPQLYVGHIAVCRTEHKSRYFTSFGVKWDTFLAFFGDLELDNSVRNDDHLSQQRSMQLDHEQQTYAESPRRSVPHEQTDGGTSSLPVPGNPGCLQSITSDEDQTITPQPLTQSHHESGSEQVGNPTELWDHGASAPVESIIHNINAENEIAFYNIHDAQLAVAYEGGQSSVRACEEYSRGYLRMGYTFAVVEDGILLCESSSLLNNSQHKLRFVFRKNGSASMAPTARLHIPLLIQKFHPGSNMEQFWRHLWFR